MRMRIKENEHLRTICLNQLRRICYKRVGRLIGRPKTDFVVVYTRSQIKKLFNKGEGLLSSSSLHKLCFWRIST